jgi:hypothetical protein
VTIRTPARILFPAALLVGTLAGCAASGSTIAISDPAAGTVRVRLMHNERPVPGARIAAVRNPGVAYREESAVATANSDGRADIALAPGNWYVSASADLPPIFGWYGANPVQIRGGESVDIAIPAVPAVALSALTRVAPTEETVAGEVVAEDGSVAGAAVAFYLDAATQFRGPGYLEAETDERGRFEARVSPGRYWIVARRRSGQHPFGPLEPGDIFGFYPGNPLEVREGERVAVRVPAVRVLKKSGWSGPSALRARVTGTIRDASGRPLPGYRAFLHGKEAMLGKPEFVSEPSGADGGYLIWVDREGTFYLGARAEIGAARGQREAIGLYRGSPDHAIEVRLDGADFAGFDIVVEGDQQ